MYRKIKKINIILWILIALFLIFLLVHLIINSKGNYSGNLFQFNFKYGENTIQKDEKVSINECENINVECLDYDVVIVSTEEEELRVVEESNETLKEEEKISVSKKDNNIVISKPKIKKETKIFNFKLSSNEITLYIPNKYDKNLYLKTTSGNAEIKDNLNLNKINLKQHSGNFTCEDSILVNEINLETTSGNIEAHTIDAKLYNMNASSGNIDIDKLSGDGKINTTSGNIQISFKDIKEMLEASAQSGNIEIDIDKNIDFEFYGKVSSGNINTNFDVDYKDKKHNEAVAKVGDKSYRKINLKTTSGNIEINQK